MVNCCCLVSQKNLPVPLKSISVEVQVKGHVATVTSTLQYVNEVNLSSGHKFDKDVELFFFGTVAMVNRNIRVNSVHAAFIAINKHNRETVRGPLIQRRIPTQGIYGGAPAWMSYYGFKDLPRLCGRGGPSYFSQTEQAKPSSAVLLGCQVTQETLGI